MKQYDSEDLGNQKTARGDLLETVDDLKRGKVGAEPGRIGRFIVLEKLGEGGMGVVYAAYDNQLDRKVAIKLVRDGSSGDSLGDSRMQREAQAMAKLSHPNVVQIYEVGVFGRQVFVVMEFIKGQTLRDWIAETKPDWRAVASKYLEAGRGLQAAHEKGLIHRDFKPDNVLCGDDGRVCVVDFGLARAGSSGPVPTLDPEESARTGKHALVRAISSADVADAGSSRPSTERIPRVITNSELSVPLTQAGTVLGTPAYMSPEQHAGEATDETSDQFSFCAALFEGLYGQLPFSGQTPERLRERVREGILDPPPEDSEVPAWLRDIALRGLASNPEQRWPSMGALLGAMVDDPAVAQRRRRKIALIGLVVATLLVGLGWVMAGVSERAERERVAKKQAQAQRDQALKQLSQEARRARDAARMTVAQRLAEEDPTRALSLVRELEEPQAMLAWAQQSAVLLRARVARVVLEGHEAAAYGVAFSPDGQYIITASQDRKVRRFRADGRGQPVVLGEHDGTVRSVSISPDGTMVATASYDGSARIWPLAGGQPVVLKGHEERLFTAGFSPDSQRVVTASADRTIRIWPADGSGSPRILSGHTDAVRTAFFTSDGQYIVSSSFDGTIRRWPSHGRKSPTTLASIPDRLYWASIDRSGERVATASEDGLVRIIRIDGSKEPILLRGHENTTYMAEFSPDGRYVVSASRDKTARIWNLDGQRQVAVLRGHSSFILGAQFSADSAQVATASYDNSVRVWDVAGREPVVLSGHGDNVPSLEFLPETNLLVTASLDGVARLWDSVTGELIREFVGHTDGLAMIDISRDGTLLATPSRDGTIRIWRLDGSAQPMVLRGHTDTVLNAEFSPDGTRLLTDSSDGTTRIWDLVGDREPVILANGGATFEAPVFDPSGTRVVTGTIDGVIRVWDATTGDPLTVLSGHEGEIRGVAFSPDGTRIVTTANDRTARIFRADGTGRPVVLRGHRDVLFSPVFHPRGHQFLTYSADASVRIWNADGSGRPVVLSGPRDPVLNAVFSPDGDLVAAIAGDRAWVWNADGSGQPTVLAGHGAELRYLQFSPDGTRLATGANDKTVRVWREFRPLHSLTEALWQATDHCLPVRLRQELLGLSEGRSKGDFERCRTRVDQSRR